MEKTALVCGATQGIGLAVTKHLLRSHEYGIVFATFRESSNLDALKELQASMNGGPALVLVELNAERSSDYEDLENLIAQHTRRLDFLFNAIGVLHDDVIPGPERSLKEIDGMFLMQSFQINTLPFALLVKHLEAFLRATPVPRIVTLSAKVGSIGDNRLGGWYGYRASKAALNMLVKNVAIEMTRTTRQALVVAMHPGTTVTSLSEKYLSNQNVKYKLHQPEESAENLIRVIANLDPNKDNGKFLSYTGEEIPW